MTEILELNDDFGHPDTAESKWPPIFPLGIYQSTPQGNSRCALGKKGNVKEK